MADLTVTNWFGDLISHPAVIVDAHTVEDIIAVLNDPVSTGNTGWKPFLLEYNSVVQ